MDLVVGGEGNVIVIWDGLGTEPGTLLGYDGAVFGEEDEDERVERGKVAAVCGVAGVEDLVIDVCEEGV